MVIVGYREILPAPALRRHVACYWERTGEDPSPHRVLPDGCMDILFWLGDALAEPRIIGTMTRAIVAGGASGASVMGVRFRPGEAFAFLDVLAADARDASLTAREAGRPDLLPLADAVGRPSMGVAGRARAIDAWLLSRLPSARPADPRVRRAVTLLEASRGTVRVADVAVAAGLGDRQLERAFAERVGIAPKALARVFRFEALVATVDRHLRAASPRGVLAIPWARAATDVGYADQAHMTREARALAGVTPTALAAERMSDSFKA